MTNFDIRLRRSQFTERRIQRHKNYESLLSKHQQQQRKKIKGVVLVAFIILIALAISLAIVVFSTSNDKKDKKNLPNKEVQSEKRPLSMNGK